MNIKESYNGYWISNDWLYLDTFESHINKKISFDDFVKDFHFYDYDNKEWLGNNPFSKSECDRFWLENEKAMVEICVFERNNTTDFIIYKVITDNYDNANELVKDIMELNILYDNIIKAFTNYIKEIHVKLIN